MSSQRKNLFKLSRNIILATILTVGSFTLSYNIAQAALTLDATNIISDANITIKSASSSTIIIGDPNQTGTITIASSTQVLTLDLGKGTSALTINIGSGAGGHTLNIATGTSTAKTINLGTGAVANVITVGSASASSVSISSLANSFTGTSTFSGAVTLSNPSSNSLIYINSTGVITALASSTSPNILTATSTSPYFTWEPVRAVTSLNGLTAGVQSFVNDTNVTITSSNASHTIGWSGVLPFSRGGTNTSTVITNGALIYSNGASFVGLASSTAGKILTATGTAPYFSWQTNTATGVSGLAAGGVTFANSAGNLAQSSTQLYWDDTNGRLGIGTTSPTAQLNLAGSGQELHLTDGSANSYGESLKFRKSRGSVGSPTVVSNNDEILTILAQGHSGTTFQNAASIRAFVDGATISNTSMPGRLTFFTTPSGSVTDVERVRIDSSGNVGIGTTSPGLDSSGWGSPAPLYLTIDRGATANAAILQLGRNTTTDGVTIGVLDFINTGNTGAAGAGRYGVAQIRVVNADASGGGGDSGGHITFVTKADAGGQAEAVRITSSGNVGIGTTAPTSLLHLGSDSLTAAGGIKFGSAGDTNLYRGQAGSLFTDSNLIAYGSGKNIQVGQGLTGVNGAGVIAISNVVTVPTAGTGGGQLYVEAGALKYRGSAGTVTTVATADYSEDLPARDDVEHGDLVSLTDSPNPKSDDPTSPFLLEKSQQPYDQKLIGIVSSFAGDTKTNGFYQPIALVGRVPAKVSAENGPIAKGDPITSSSIPGVGMRATHQGRVIAIALEPYSAGGVGKIMVFVNRTWYLPKEVKPESKLFKEEKDNLQPLIKAPAEVIEKLPGFVEKAGLKIKDKAVEFKELFIEKLSTLEIITDKLKARSVETETIQIKDRATGESYCTWIENGQWQKAKGECSTLSSTLQSSGASSFPSAFSGVAEPQPESKLGRGGEGGATPSSSRVATSTSASSSPGAAESQSQPAGQEKKDKEKKGAAESRSQSQQSTSTSTAQLQKESLLGSILKAIQNFFNR